MRFSYTASDSQGRTVSGSVDAADASEAQAQVSSMGLRPLQIFAPLTPLGQETTRTVDATPYGYTQQPPGLAAGVARARNAHGAPAAVPAGPVITADDFALNHLVYPLWTGVSLTEQAQIYRQLGAMYDAGLSLHMGISALLEGHKSGTVRRCLAGLQQQVLQGVPLSVAMGKYSGFFPAYHRAVIGAGEATGSLRPMLNRLAESLEMDYQFRWELWKEVYTKGAFVIGNFIVMPMVILWLSHQFLLMILVFLILLAPGVLIACAYVAVRLLKQVRFFYDAMMARTPGIAGIAQGLAVSRFCRALGSLYEAGVPISTAVQYAAEACGNYTLGELYKRAVRPLQQGSSLIEAFTQTRAFPSLMLSMLPVAQETASLTPLMDKVARHYELESKAKLGNFSMTVGLVITIICGIFCFILVLLVYMGYLNGTFNTGV